ncbi:hypothetical protein JMJ77_0014497 [Colletotrichum scovillei]|uniref:Uncharacterized protein n=1 Tax=Colletotrichum scovillei TaxID=1209932 RepID=A0A9P7R5I9_9PEZI|nr:hypothetical protein JMJ77_0014497 [Colletotrichum scovillei]KAG7066064.1 hypothetical protein JMJ78_0012802 [Colletotrichum scovillei]KAG7068634.1 hypothetical protein JMJ76_0008316 [Colletotrichum scovillei]
MSAGITSQQSQVKPVTPMTPETTITVPPLGLRRSPSPPSPSFVEAGRMQTISPLEPAERGTPQVTGPSRLTSVGQLTVKPNQPLLKSVKDNNLPQGTAASTQRLIAEKLAQKESATSLKPDIMKDKPYTGQSIVGWRKWAKRHKNTAYSRYPACNEAVNTHISKVLWDLENKKPKALSEQKVYGDFMKDWKETQYRQRPPSAPLMESIRLINNVSLPQDIVTKLEISGWDATKCCDPTLPYSEKKLAKVPPNLKGSSKDPDSELENDSEEVALAQAKQQQRGSSLDMAITLIDDPEDEDIQSSGQSSRQASSAAEAVITSPKKALPPLASFQPPKPPRVVVSQNEESEAAASVSHHLHGIPSIGSEKASRIGGVAKSAEQLTEKTESTNLFHQDDNSLSNRPPSPYSSSSSSSKSGKRIATKDLRRALHKVKKLDALSGKHSTQLEDQGGQVLAQTQRLDNIERAVGEQASNSYNFAMELEAHTTFLKKQDLALAQLRNDNQALRACLQDVLYPLAQAVNTMHKSTKRDKKTLEANAKRAKKELEEFEAAGRNAEAVKRGTRNLGQILRAPQGDRMDMD